MPGGRTAALEPASAAVLVSCLSGRVRAVRACRCTVCPVRTPGSLARRMTPGPGEAGGGFGVADGSGQHDLGGLLVFGSGERLCGGDPLDDPLSAAVGSRPRVTSSDAVAWP